MTYYAGLDVSLRSTHVCVIDDEGELLAECKTDSEVADISFSNECRLWTKRQTSSLTAWAAGSRQHVHIRQIQN